MIFAPVRRAKNTEDMDIGIVLGSCTAVSKCENCNDFQMTLEIRERLKLS